MAPRRFLMLTLLASACLTMPAEATISFFQSATVSVPRTAKALAAGDFDHNQIDDVVVVSKGSNKVSILLLGPNGNFLQAAALRVGKSLRTAAVGDFNHDGNLDIALATGTKNAFLLFGAGNGTFAGARTLRRCCSGFGAAVADLDGVNGDDLIFSNPSNDDVSVFLNKGGDATFGSEKRFKAGRRPSNVVVADFNGDGVPDVAALNIQGRGNDVTVFLTVAGGNLSPVASFITGRKSRFLTVADINGDGLPDLVIGNQAPLQVAILLNQGGGLFSAPIAVPFTCSLDATTTVSTCSLQGVVAADFDGDGITDLAVALSFPGTSNSSTSSTGNDTIDIARGLGNEVFETPVRIQNAATSIRAMIVGNFNADNKPDIAVSSTADATVRIYINNSTVPPIGPTVTRAVGTSTPTPPGGGGSPTPTPTISSGGGSPTPTISLICDTSHGDGDCVSKPGPFCSLTGPGTQGICCDTPCSGANEHCDLPGSEGTCKTTGLNNGEPCDVAAQCNSNVCAQGYCCNTACDGVTNRCDVDGNVGTCVLNPHIVTPTSTLPPPLTSTPTPGAGAKQLGQDCISGSECQSSICQNSVCCSTVCASGESCNLTGGAGTCLPQNIPNGQPCTASGQCVSGNCPDAARLCCNTACTGANESCDVAGHEGTCVTAGSNSNSPTPTRTATPSPSPQRTVFTIYGARGSGCSIAPAGKDGNALGWLLLLPFGWWLATRTSLATRLRHSRIRIRRDRSR